MSGENTGFAELTAISNFSFLQGGAHPQEMVQRAAHLGYQAVGLADRNTLAGVVRGHVAAREAGIRFVPGARLVTQCDFEAVCYPRDRTAYARPVAMFDAGQPARCERPVPVADRRH